MGRVAYQVLAGLAPTSDRRWRWPPARPTASDTSSAPGTPDHPGEVASVIRPIAIIGPTGTGKSNSVGGRRETRRRDLRRGDQCRRHAAVPRNGHRDSETASGATPRRPASPTRRPRRHRHGNRRPLPAGAVADVEAVAGRGALPIIVGGRCCTSSPLLDDWAFPATDPAVRARWEDRLAEVGTTSPLHAELGRRDPAAAARRSCPPTVVAWCGPEVIELTGMPFAASAPTIGESRWNTAIVGLDWETTALDQRLAVRTDTMFDAGLVDGSAICSTADCGTVSPLRALGYAHVLEALDAGEVSPTSTGRGS